MKANLRRLLIQCGRNYSAKPAPIDKEAYPNKLFYKKQKTPQYMYIAHDEAARAIETHVKPLLDQIPGNCNVAVELNPGQGLLTQRLLENANFEKIVLFETMSHFMPQLTQLQAKHPKRVVAKHGDFVSMWKLAFQDKMDNGNRVSTLLNDIPKRAHDDDPNCVMFGAVGAYNFFKHLVNSLVFQNSLLTWGRCEMFLVVPPPIYIHLTCNSEVGYMVYRSTSILFQILYEYQFIARVPREYFIPTQTVYKKNKGSKLSRIKSIDPDSLYLVRIAPRRTIFDLCSVDDLPALWYFIKQNCISRRNRVIPNLEKWIPGCGPRLIVNPPPTKPVQQLYPHEDANNLPPYSNRCSVMSTCDFYPKLSIFTEFGDLSPSQMLTLFMQFRNWPEYSESTFVASLENSMLKIESAIDENIDDIEDDEIDNTDSNEAQKPIKSRKRKAASTEN